LNAQKFEKIIFLDRDGVINEDPIGDYVKTWEDFRFIPGALDALQELTGAGFKTVIISSQAGIGDRVYSEQALNDITDKMLAECKKNGVVIRNVYYCLHGKNADCDCRKPKTGLFEQAEREMRFDRNNTFFIGDKFTDVEAGNRFGLRCLFVLTGHGQNDRQKFNQTHKPERIFPSIAEAARYVLGQAGK